MIIMVDISKFWGDKIHSNRLLEHQGFFSHFSMYEVMFPCGCTGHFPEK